MKIAGALALLWLISGCQPPGPPTADPTAIESVARGYIEDILNGSHWERYDRYFAAQVNFNGATVGRAELERRVTSFRDAYPDFRVTIEEQISEGDLVVTRMTCTGTHLGSDLGVPATGIRVQFTGIAIDRIQNGKIVEMRFLGDVWARMLQIRPDLRTSRSSVK